MSLNKVLLIGNAGRDPEIRYLENGVAVVTLSVATTERYKDKNGETREQTDWHNVVFWRHLAELVERDVKKGSPLFIEGKLRSRSWEDQSGHKKYTTEVVADNLRVLGLRGSEYNFPQQGCQHGYDTTSDSPAELSDKVDAEDNLPF